MNRIEMGAVIVDVVGEMRAERRLYPDAWALELADAIIAAQGDERAEFHVRKNAPDTSKAVSVKIREGTLLDDVLALFVQGWKYGAVGFSDDEAEVALKRSHQSVSGARNTLVKKGYLVDSGERRPNRYGNMAIRWTYTGKKVER